MSAISSISGTSGASATNSLSSMSASDFLKVMLTQLQQQDPLNPSDSNQLLSQISQISQLQASQQTTQTLQGLTLQQSIGAASGLIGHGVQGQDTNGNQIQGLVTGVLVQNQQVILQLDSGQSLPMQNVTAIGGTVQNAAAPVANATGAATPAS